MSRPRRVIPGSMLFLTRRARVRTFLLRPSPRANQIFLYVVAVIAQRYGILIHALCFLSDHWHSCITDPLGMVVEFQRECHEFIAHGLNRRHKESEGVWSSKQCGRQSLQHAEDLMRKIAYTMANPVSAGAVRYGHSWPGVRAAWPRKPLTIKRPPHFFRGPEAGGNWPDEVVLEFTRPPGYEDVSDEDLAAIIEAGIEAKEQEARVERDTKGISFLGRRAVLKQSRHARARSKEERFRLHPEVVCGDRETRIRVLTELRAWRARYRVVWNEWRRGDREVVFPHGTWEMRVVHGARCEEAPP